MDRKTLEDVKTFTYLGSLIDKQSTSDTDVEVQMNKAMGTFFQFKIIWNSNQFSANIKVTILNTNVKTVLLSETETCMENYQKRPSKVTGVYNVYAIYFRFVLRILSPIIYCSRE